MTAACHLEVLVEEPSMEAFLSELLDRLLLGKCTFKVHPFQGKSDLLNKLEARLRAYAAWLPVDHRVVVVVDRDDEDCHELKRRLEDIARRSGLSTRSTPRSGFWQVVNRIVVEDWNRGISAIGKLCALLTQGSKTGSAETRSIATLMPYREPGRLSSA